MEGDGDETLVVAPGIKGGKRSRGQSARPGRTGSQHLGFAHRMDVGQQPLGCPVAHDERFQIDHRKRKPRSLQQIARLSERDEGTDARMDAARNPLFGLVKCGPQLAQGLLAQGDGEKQAVGAQYPPGFRQHGRRIIGPMKQHARDHEIQTAIGTGQGVVVAHEARPPDEPLGHEIGMHHLLSRDGERPGASHHQRPLPAPAMIGEPLAEQALGLPMQEEGIVILAARHMTGAPAPQKITVEQPLRHRHSSIRRLARRPLDHAAARLHLAGWGDAMQKILRYGAGIAILTICLTAPTAAAGAGRATGQATVVADRTRPDLPAPAALDAKGLFAVETTVAAVDLYTPAAPDRPRRLGELTFLSGLQIYGHDDRFGGFSGFVLDGNGRTLLAVSDNGFWMRAELERDRNGIPRDVGNVVMGPIHDFRGDSLTPVAEDAEALTLLSGRLGSRLLVAFEHWHRLWTYPVGTHGPPFLAPMVAMAEPLRVPKKVLQHPPNRGIEAAVELRPGRLLLFSEGARTRGPDDGGLQAWLVDFPPDGGSRDAPGRAQSLALQPFEEGFAPTAAALWPGCCVILLERRYRVMTGVEAAIVAIPLARIRPGVRVAGRLLARLAPPVTVDNFEGLWVEPDSTGRARILLLSDDNYRRSQRTLLMTFLWANAPPVKSASDSRRTRH